MHYIISCNQNPAKLLIIFVPFTCYICSGDTDAVVPLTATRYSIDALKLATIKKWYPWYDNGKVS